MTGSIPRRSKFGMALDKIALCGIICVGGAAYFYRMTRSFYAAIALSVLLLCAILCAITLYRRTPLAMKHSSRLKRAAAGAILDNITLKPHGDAELELLNWVAAAHPLSDITRVGRDIRARWREDKTILARLYQKHPADSLTCDEICDVWRAAREMGAFGAIVMSTSNAAPAALHTMRELPPPRIRLFDRDALILTALPYLHIALPPPTLKMHASARISAIARAIVNRASAPRYFLYGSSLVIIYVTTGMRAALPCAIIVLALGMFSLKKPREEKTLF